MRSVHVPRESVERGYHTDEDTDREHNLIGISLKREKKWRGKNND